MGKTSSKAIATVASGTLVGQFAGAISMPLVSRVYEPSQFGQFGAISAVLIVIGSVASGRFDLAVPIPRRDSDVYSVVGAGLVSAGLAGLMVTAFALIFPGLASALSHGASPSTWVVGSLGVLGLGGTTLLSQLAARQSRFRALAQRNAIQPAVLSGTQVLLGLGGLGVMGLIGGFALGQLLGFASLFMGAGFASAAAKKGLNLRRVGAAARRFSKFPTLMVPAGLLNAGGVQMPVVLIAFISTSDAAGWYSLAQRTLALPVALAGTATSYVYLSEASKAMRTNPPDVLALFASTSRRQLIAGIALTIAAFALGPSAFAWVFGSEWTQAGEYARAISFGVGAQLFASPISQTVVLAERQATQLMWDAGRLILVIVAILGVYSATNDVLSALWAYSAVSVVAYGAMWFINWKAAQDLARRPLVAGPSQDAP